MNKITSDRLSGKTGEFGFVIERSSRSHSTNSWWMLRVLDRKCWELKRLAERLQLYRCSGEPTLESVLKDFAKFDQKRKIVRMKRKNQLKVENKLT